MHVYIHFPFCERKCRYCSFASIVADPATVNRYCSALEREIIQTAPCIDASTVSTIYLGGGTPSCVPPRLLTRIITTLFSSFSIAPDAEITIECNPHSLSSHFCHAMLSAGVNRFSLGVQSLHDTELQFLGRLHSAQQALQAFRLLRECGVTNISADLIFGMPLQSQSSWMASLSRLTDECHPEHISLYALSVESGTPLHRWKRANPRSPLWPDDDTVMDWFWLAADLAAEAGYQRYEISNYALPGFESRHNMAYWDINNHYIGFGAAAHSFCRFDGCAAPRRFRNIKNPRLFSGRVLHSRSFRVFSKPLSPSALLGEEIILGLRRTSGIVLRPEHFSLFDAVIKQQLADGLLVMYDDNRIALSHRGTEIANTVMADYV